MKRYPVGPLSEFPPGSRAILDAGKLEVGVFNVGGQIRAYRNACPHAGAPVCMGRISGTSLASCVYEYLYGREGQILRCPWHGWEFDLLTGAHLVDPAVRLKGVPVETAGSEDLQPVPTEQSEGILYVLMPG